MHDVVVVGGGGSGVPLAGRLAERGVSVLLLERGAVDLGAPVPAHLVPGAQAGHPGTSTHAVDLRPGLRWDLHRGQVLGGSTAVNGGYFIRARAQDYERWARVGGRHWSPEAVLPLLRRLESDAQFGDRPEHGDAGPMPVDRGPAHPASEALTAAALSSGLLHHEDHNDWAGTGVGPVPTNTRDGRRFSTAVAYLRAGVPNGLEIRGSASVVGVRIVGGRAVGVETTDGFVPAGQVVLSAGAIGSPHLLLVSGIGPADELRHHGIAVHEDLPVGETLSDHPQVVVDWQHPRSVEPWPAPASWLGAVAHAGAVELLQSLLPMPTLMSGGTGPAGSTLIVSDLGPRARGHLRLHSPDPSVAPEVNLGYLRDEEDRSALRSGVRLAATLLGHEALGPGRPPAGLDPHVLDQDPLLDSWIDAHLGTAVHTCSTAPMGAVTDGAGRVRGIEGLRVADTSILPTAPTRGPANTAVLIGELIADRMTVL